jgi:hypothetical protein
VGIGGAWPTAPWASASKVRLAHRYRTLAASFVVILFRPRFQRLPHSLLGALSSISVVSVLCLMSRYIRCSNPLANRIHDKDGHVLKTNEKCEWTSRISQLVPVRHCIAVRLAWQENHSTALSPD